MASLQQYPNGIYHVHFRFAGQRVKRSLKTQSLSEANSRVARLAETIRLVEMGRLEIPDDQDVATFLLADGKPVLAKQQSTFCTLAQSPIWEAERASPDISTKRSAEQLGMMFYEQGYEPYKPLLRQLYSIHKQANQKRRRSGLKDRVPREFIPTRLRPVRVFAA